MKHFATIHRTQTLNPVGTHKRENNAHGLHQLHFAIKKFGVRTVLNLELTAKIIFVDDDTCIFRTELDMVHQNGTATSVDLPQTRNWKVCSSRTTVGPDQTYPGRYR